MTHPRIVIFANGLLPDLEKARLILRSDDFLLGADGGTHHILALGRRPDLVIGDLDSLDPQVHARLEGEGVKIVRYPRDKDATDLELAVQHALSLQPPSVLIVAALGERLDQTIGNLALASDAALANFDIRMDDGVETAFFCRDQAAVQGRRGDVVSLLPWGDAVTGVRTEGLKWALHGETLLPHKTRGLSNEMQGERASVQIDSGVLLVTHRRLD
jgi:thiamine pyrophosphokinase